MRKALGRWSGCLLFSFLAVGCADPMRPAINDNPDFEEVEPVVGDPMPIVGTAQLPAGSELDPATLRVETHAGSAAVNADGMYNAESLTNLPGLAALVDENDTPVLLGFIGIGDNPKDIDAKSTAAALLYFAIGGWTLPANRMPELLNEISSSTECEDLATVIETAVAANAMALRDGDSSIDAALAGAAITLLDGNNGSASAKAIKSIALTQQSINGADGFLTIDPDDRESQSGARLMTAGTTQVNLSNAYARRACFYVFQSAFDDQTGTRIELSPVEQLGSVFEVAPVERVRPEINMNDVLDPATAPFYQPAISDFVALASVEGASRTELTLVLIGPALDESSPAAILSDPDYVLVQQEWQTKLAELQAETFTMEFMVPLAESLCVGLNIAIFDSQPNATFSLTQLVQPIVEGAGISLETTDGYLEAVNVVLDRALNNVMYRENLIDAIVTAYDEGSGQRFSRNRLQALFTRLGELESIRMAIQSGITRDVGRVLLDLRNSRSAEVWNAQLTNVLLSPDEATITQNNTSVTFNVDLAEANLDELTYEWSLTGDVGELLGLDSDGTQLSGMDFTSDVGSVDYFVSDPALVVDGALATVSVRVFDGNTFVGQASAEVSGHREDDSVEPGPCEALPGWSDQPEAPLVRLDVPSTVEAGGTLTFTITINREATEVYSINPATVSVKFLSISEVGYLRNDENQGLILLDGAPIVSSPTDDIRTTGITTLSSDPLVRARPGVGIQASGLIQFPAGGPDTRTISVPVPEDAMSLCASDRNVSAVIITGLNIPNFSGIPIPINDDYAFAQFYVLR